MHCGILAAADACAILAAGRVDCSAVYIDYLAVGVVVSACADSCAHVTALRVDCAAVDLDHSEFGIIVLAGAYACVLTAAGGVDRAALKEHCACLLFIKTADSCSVGVICFKHAGVA